MSPAVFAIAILIGAAICIGCVYAVVICILIAAKQRG